jgi:hypothetical protein
MLFFRRSTEVPSVFVADLACADSTGSQKRKGIGRGYTGAASCRNGTPVERRECELHCIWNAISEDIG